MVEVGERYTGSPVRRVEDVRILTGRGRFTADVTRPGLLHAAFVRSPFAHARIRAVDVSAARASGVVAVITGEELDAVVHPAPVGMAALVGGYGPAKVPLLALGTARFVGDPVVLVVAESRARAEDVGELVHVDYEELAPVLSFDAALDPRSPTIFDELPGNLVPTLPPATFGDVDGAFARADHVLRTRLVVHRHQHVPMEGRAIVADYDPGAGTLWLHVAAQSVHLLRTTVATCLGMQLDDVRVVADEVGGSFGMKKGNSREELAVAAASRLLGRPVTWIEDRRENLMASGQAREERFDVEVAFTGDGDITGLKVHMAVDAGAYPGIGHIMANTLRTMMPGPYRLEGFAFEPVVAVTNKPSYLPYRGPWASETFVRERLIDLVARELGMEPLEVRRRNLAIDGEPPLTMLTGRSLEGITCRPSLERIAQLVDGQQFRHRQTAARAEGRHLGLGIATYIEGAPGPRRDPPLMHETVRAGLGADGTVVIATGQMPHGQGHRTTFAQIAADEIGIPFDQVRVVVGDTDAVPWGFTGASRAAGMAGGATLFAARALRQRLVELGAAVLEASVDDIELAGGMLAVRGVPTSAMTLAELVAVVVEPGRLPADADASLTVETVYDGGRGGWSGGTHCAEVEVDVETGQVCIRRYVVVLDCGQVIHPAIVEGQVRGGVAQGIGAVLLERSAYDADGQLLSGTLSDYLLPTATDVPRIEIEHVETVLVDPDVNFRGVGEGGMIVAPATIGNAIEDALAPLGVRILEQHLPPTRLLELIGTIDAGGPPG